MRAISLHQPFASAVASGLKTFETRSWPTRHRGPLAIHAARRPLDGARRALALPFIRAGQLPDVLPFGYVVAVARLVTVHRAEDLAGSLTEAERRWGDFGPGRFAWELADVRSLAVPVALVGRQRFFSVPDGVLAAPANSGRLDVRG